MAVTLPQASESAALHELHGIRPEMSVPPWLDVDDLMFRLRRYFEGDPVLFEDPVDPSLGTEFQRRVWDITRAIPPGGTRTYGEIAREAGSPGAARAVGQAMARNPCPVIIPCHRVVGHDGRLTGFGGGLDMKQSMLDMESANA
jgi:methylated-DNA-[protein]-cysteine S-methyltransferase